VSSLYLHLPYCLYKCHYCDFNSYATKPQNIPFQAYAQAVLNELDFRLQNEPAVRRAYGPWGGRAADPAVAAHLSTPLETIFLGGGTPSLFPPEILKSLLEKILDRVAGMTQLSKLDITMEANPGTITQKTIEDFASVAGITRLSLGVQSLHDKYLGKYGRIHSADEALQAVQWIKVAGFKSWSCDLMFGFPEQTSDEWKWELEKILTYDPPHLSCYAFTVEKEAPYGRQVALGNAPVPDEDIQAEMFEWTREFLTQSGYVGYEISNFAKLGQESQHNLNYWNYGSYLGLGAGAVSFVHSSQSPFEGYRQMGLKTPEEYLKQPHAFLSHENIPAATAMQEFMMMGLRLKQGVNAANFQKLFGVRLEDHFAEPISQARQKGWMNLKEFSLTPQGFQMANQVVGLFL